MYRLATLLALLIALVVAVGCGGSGDDSDSPPSAVAQATESEPSDDDTGGSTSDGDAKKQKNDGNEKSSGDKDDEADDDDEPLTHAEQHEAAEEAYRKLPLEDKEELLKTSARNALLRFGLTMVDADLARGGRSATVIVARKGACNFVASQESNLELAITQGVLELKSVRFEMAGTGQQLGYYVLGCKRPEIPNGAGRVVLDHDGVGGPYTSKPFEITSKHWALEWENQGNSLAVILEPLDKEAKDNYAKPVGSQKPESGRYEYTGGGTYRIQAYGAGGWRVRVKEIG